MKCEDCKWWERDVARQGEDPPEYGDCHRYPPASPGGQYEFPVVPKWEWCGEFEEERKTP